MKHRETGCVKGHLLLQVTAHHDQIAQGSITIQSDELRGIGKHSSS